MAYSLDEFKKIGTSVDKQYIAFWQGNTGRLPDPVTPNMDRLSEEELNHTAFKISPKKPATPFFVDNALKGIVDVDNWEMFVKACFLSGYFLDQPYTDFRRYIFRLDKEAKHVGKNGTYVRADYLKISIGAQNKFHKAKKVVTIRANGSVEGISEKYGNYISLALPYLVKLQQGPAAAGPLLDIIDAEPIKDHSLTPGIESRYVDLHHILVINGASSHKTVEPTILLGKSEFTKLRYDDIIELMKCIALPPGLHKEIHSHFGNNSGFTNWRQLFTDKKIKMLPYYLLNEENYIQTLNWLDNACINFNKSDCVSYDDFIKSIS